MLPTKVLPDQGTWERGPASNLPLGDLRRGRKRHQSRQRKVPFSLLRSLTTRTGTSWVTQTLTCSKVVERPGTGGRGLQRLELTWRSKVLSDAGGWHACAVDRGGDGQQQQASRGFFRARAPASSVVSEPRAYPRSHAARAALRLNEEHLRDPSEVLGTGRGGFSGAVWGWFRFKESAWREQSLDLEFHGLL